MFKKNSLILSILAIVCLVIPVLAGCSNKDETGKPVVLLTDFGSSDYRGSQVKGIIYTNYPEVNLIEASQDVPSFDVPTGAFILNLAAREFPSNTVFVGIIAPYAQEETRYLILTTQNDKIFVLPDNGLLTYVAKEMGIKSVYKISNQSLFDKPIAQLAAERIQGKIGALIASGTKPQDIGTPLEQPRTLDIQDAAISNNKLMGTVVYVDNFGNCVTNILGAGAAEFRLQPGMSIQVSDGQSTVTAKYGTIYSDVPQGKEVVFVNNNLDMLQLSINLGSFGTTYKMKAGTKFEIEKLP